MFWDKGRNQPSRQNARCVIYIRNDLSFKLKEDLMNDKVPEIWLELGEPKKRRVLMCLFYREFAEWNSRLSTNSIKMQKERFQEWLLKVGALAEQDKELWLVGDFNLELSRKDDNSYDRKCLAMLAHEELLERGMIQIIYKPTHVYWGKKSTIDLIFTSEPRKISEYGTITMSSDHDCIYMIRKSKFIQK